MTLPLGAAEDAIWVLTNGLNGQRTLGMDDETKRNLRSVIDALKTAHIINVDDPIGQV